MSSVTLHALAWPAVCLTLYLQRCSLHQLTDAVLAMQAARLATQKVAPVAWTRAAALTSSVCLTPQLAMTRCAPVRCHRRITLSPRVRLIHKVLWLPLFPGLNNKGPPCAE